MRALRRTGCDARLATSALLTLIALLASCSKRDPAPAASTVDASAPVAIPDAGAPVQDAALAKKGWTGPVGTVTGRVSLKKGAALPLAAPVLGPDGKPPISGDPCPPVDASDRRTVNLHGDTLGLSPVHVAITDFTEAPVREPRVYELFIDACRLRPTLLGAQSGDRVRITNRSAVALLPVLPGDRFMQALLPSEAREFPVKKLGTVLLGCGFANYCGETALITLSHPLFAVTEPDGRFVIPNVPAGQKMTLHAWHPLFDVTSVPFELAVGGSLPPFELELSPTASAKSEPAPPKPGKSKKPAKAAELPPPDWRIPR